MRKTKAQKGITLIALIITIIVLLILAVVSIRAIQGDGIIFQAKRAKQTYKDKSDEEKSMLDFYGEYLKNKGKMPMNEEEYNAIYGINGENVIVSENSECISIDEETGKATINFDENVTLNKIALPYGIKEIDGKRNPDINIHLRLNEIILPPTCTKISDNAFQNEEYIKYVTALGPMDYIGNYSFYNSNLESFNIEYEGEISNGTIGENAFAECGNLTAFRIPNGYTDIGYFAFGHTKITSLNIPSSVTEIKAGTFACMMQLKEISLPNTLTKIEGNPFPECESLVELTIPESVNSIGDFVLNMCYSLEKITLPTNCSGTLEISLCNKLTKLTIPEGITELKMPISYSKDLLLEELNLPNSLVKLDIIQSTPNLKRIVLGENLEEVVLEGTGGLETIYIKSSKLNSYLFYTGPTTKIYIKNTELREELKQEIQMRIEDALYVYGEIQETWVDPQ